jgi:uncharacterized membrane protein
MSETPHHSFQLERIVFFSDAVFAIAITLLIIEIKVPHLEHETSDRDFLIALVRLIPNFVGYFFSFLVIGAYWVGHHRIYGMIVNWNYGLIWRNVFFLLAIAFMPFTTAFFSEYPTRLVPIVLYAAAFSLAGALEILQWRYAIKNGLTDPRSDRAELDHLTWRIAVLPMAGVAAIVIGLVKPVFAGFAFMLIPFAHRMIAAKFIKAKDNSELTNEN